MSSENYQKLKDLGSKAAKNVKNHWGKIVIGLLIGALAITVIVLGVLLYNKDTQPTVTHIEASRDKVDELRDVLVENHVRLND
jgi:uncharacterized membrane-anchored protein YhcB (DUF1043 family)